MCSATQAGELNRCSAGDPAEALHLGERWRSSVARMAACMSVSTRPGRHGVGREPVARLLERDHAGELVHRRLGRAVGGPALVRPWSPRPTRC